MNKVYEQITLILTEASIKGRETHKERFKKWKDTEGAQKIARELNIQGKPLRGQKKSDYFIGNLNRAKNRIRPDIDWKIGLAALRGKKGISSV